jgi:hypothetical protein
MISCIEGFFDLDQGRPSEIEMSVRFTSRGNFATLVPARIARPMEFSVGTGGSPPSGAGGMSHRGGVSDRRAIGPGRDGGPQALFISMIRGAIAAASSPAGQIASKTSDADSGPTIVMLQDFCVSLARICHDCRADLA